jgi:hypothetical protein
MRALAMAGAMAGALCAPIAAQAQSVETISVETSWDDEPEVLTYSDEVPDEAAAVTSSRFMPVDVSGYHPSRPPIARYGPFYLVAPDTVEMIGTVDSNTPRQFAAMIAAHPGIARLVMIECPGSVDEDANHVLARAVRRMGIATHVPAGGSVRSGAVDLWLAGAHRSADASAEFGVHSWRDEDGREGWSTPASDPVHADYLRYYHDMGVADDVARRFYALTNSVPFDDVRTLHARDMAALGLLDGAGR